MVAAQPVLTEKQKHSYRQLLLSGTPLSPRERHDAATWIGEPELADLAPPKQIDPANPFARGRLFACGKAVADNSDAAARLGEDEGLAEVLRGCGVLPDDDPATVGETPGVGSAERSRANESSPAGKRSRAEQSRINGARSRGPRTIDGRLAACMNAFRHGMRARLGVLPDEDVEKFRAFADGVRDELRPATPLQRDLARRVADLSWRLRRMPVLESHAVGGTSLPDAPGDTDADIINDRLCASIGGARDGVLLRLQRYATTIERSIRSCLRELRELQAAERSAIAEAGAAATPGVSATTPPTERPVAVPPVANPPPTAPGQAGTRPANTPPAKSSPSAVPTAAVPSDGMRFSGSFGATLMPMATMPIPTQAAAAIPAQAAPLTAEAAAIAVSGSFGKKSGDATRRAPAIDNDIVPIPARPTCGVAAT